MTKEEKPLLLKDLCARLPYGVIVKLDDKFKFNKGDRVLVKELLDLYCIEGIKPYLRSVYTMTEEEMDKLFDILHIDKDGKDEDWIKINDVTGIKFFLPAGRWMEEIDEAMSYLRSIHIDINGLISKGLALEAPEGMYK